MAAPKLPVFIQNFVLPAGSHVTGLQVHPSDLYTFNGSYYIAPVQPPCIIGQVCDTVAPNPAVYNSHNPYPAQQAKIIADRYIFDQHVVSVAVCPFRYIPDVRELALYRQVDFSIQYSTGNYSATGHISANMQSLTKNFVKDMVVNPQSLQDMRRPDNNQATVMGACSKQVLHWQPDNIGDRPDYIIITNNALKPYFMSLATYKSQRGIPTVIATVENIYNQYSGSNHPEQIRNYLIDVKQYWNTVHILIGGDSDIVPVQYQQQYHKAVPTDRYYNDLTVNTDQVNNSFIYYDNIDNILGRVPVKTQQEAFNLIQKIKFYENLNVNDRNYINHILLTGAYFEYPLINNTSYEIFKEATQVYNDLFIGKNKWMLLDDFFTFSNDPSYFPNGCTGQVLSKQNFTDALNQGINGVPFHFIYHADHSYFNNIGTSARKSGEFFNNQAADDLHNTYPQIMLSIGCEPGQFDRDCFAEHYINNPNGGGVAILANTNETSTDEGFFIPDAFFSKIYAPGNNNLGISAMNIYAYSYFDNATNTIKRLGARYTYELFGDPTMQVWTDAPQDIALSAPTDINIDNGTTNTYTVNINDLDEPATITVYKYNNQTQQTEIYGSQTIPAHTSSATFYLQPDTEGDVTVTATAKNYIPATESSHIHLPQAHLYVSTVRFTDDPQNTGGNSNNNGVIEQGEDIGLILTIMNSGGTLIDNVQTVLEPDTALNGSVNVTQANINASGSFAPGTHQDLRTYQFQVGTNGTMPRYLKFWLNITGTINGNDYQHRDEIYLDMTTGQLDLGPRLVIDDNSTIINPDHLQGGVEYNLYVGIANNSSVTRTINSAILTSDHENLIRVVNGTSSYVNIFPYEHKNNQTAFQIEIMENNPNSLPLNLHITNGLGVSKDFSFDLMEAYPPTVNGFHYTSTSSTIKLMWNPVTISNNGYNIYRSDELIGTYSKINKRPITGQSLYIDANLSASQTYYYKISVINTSNNEIPLDNLMTANDYNGGTTIQGYKAWTTLQEQSRFPITHSLEITSEVSSPTVMDINGDSNREIFFGSNDWSEVGANIEQGRLYAYDYRGLELFDIDDNPDYLTGFAKTNRPIYYKPALCDIDFDEHAEVFANGFGSTSHLFGYHTIDTNPNNTNAPGNLWNNANGIELTDDAQLSPILVDMNNDGTKEIVILDDTQSIHIYDSVTGNEIYSNSINHTRNNAFIIPAVADINADGYKEVVYIIQGDVNYNDNNTVYFTHFNGTDFETQFLNELNNAVGYNDEKWEIVLGDTNQDDYLEIFVIISDNTSNITYSQNSSIQIPHKLYCLEYDGQIDWDFQFDFHATRIAMGDINEDGHPELVVTNGSQISIIDRNANKMDINILGNAISEPIIADVDDDPDMEIVVNTGQYLDAYNLDGTLCSGWHIPCLHPGKPFAKSPYVGDIDNDGKNEVVIADSDATIYAWKTTGDADKIEWGTARYNAQNTGAYESINQLDLMIKDSPADTGVEPNTTTQRFWESEDIWIRNQDDGGTQHENPEYDPNNQVYVYVRVTNRGSVASTQQEVLHLYWANANTNLNWDMSWNGTTDNSGTVMGNSIGQVNIPILQPGEQRIVKVEWHIPNVDDYDEISPHTWHFCLLARVVSPNDAMTFPETTDLTSNVANNNNIAWKNVHVIDVNPNQPNNVLSGTVVVGNWSDTSHLYYLELIKDDNENGNPIFDEAEVKLKMGPKLYEAWERGGKIAEELENTGDEKKKIVKGDNVLLDNLAFDPKEFGAITLTFNFLTKKITDKDRFKYHLIQRDAQTGEIVGGETFIIQKKPRPIFVAEAQNQEVDKDDIVTLSAETINEAAIYNWYDMEGNLVYQGKDMEVSADMAKKFKLEVIATADGFKDYKEVEVKLKPNRIVSFTPNPVDNNLEVTYKINEGSSAYLMLINISGNNNAVGNYVVDVDNDTINIDMSNYPTGVYSVALVTDGQITDVKELVKN